MTTGSSALPRSTPQQVGVPEASIHALLDGLTERQIELHSLMVVRHGCVAAEGWWAPNSPDRPHLLYSLSKSFTSTAVGFAIEEGLCALTDRLVDLLPDHVPDDVDPRIATITLADVLAMSSGHVEDQIERAWSLDPHDLLRGFLRIRPEAEPGTLFAYNQPCTYAAGLVVQERSGQYLLDYLTPRLFEPLGIDPGHWDDDGEGRALAFTGLHQRTEDIARFGLLLLQRGQWQGRQVLPAGWVELATRKHIDHLPDPAGNPDWQQGYGFQYWMSRHGFRGDGAFGQFCVVVPEADLVVATTAATEDMQGVLDVVWDVLLPVLDTTTLDPTGADDVGAAAELTRRLTSLALPVLEATCDAPPEPVTFTVRDGGPDAPLAVGATMTVSPDGRDHRLEIVTGSARLVVPCGRDKWAEAALGSVGAPRGSLGMPAMRPTPVVCRGGWTSADTVEADLVLIETPHRVRLSGNRNDARLVSHWNVPPLADTRLEGHLPW